MSRQRIVKPTAATHQAYQRQNAWMALSFEDQLKALDTKLGVGIGATKQRARITKQIKARDTFNWYKDQVKVLEENKENDKKETELWDQLSSDGLENEPPYPLDDLEEAKENTEYQARNLDVEA
jgi:hypothetical protein